MYQFYLPIGDWSNDGHGKCRRFLINSNYPVGRVREAHFRIKKTTGIDIESDICSDYEENTVTPEVNAKLMSIGKLRDMGFDGFCSDEPMSAEDMAHLWLSLLQVADPELQLEFAEPPVLPFYGYDEKGRHISFVGYGVF